MLNASSPVSVLSAASAARSVVSPRFIAISLALAFAFGCRSSVKTTNKRTVQAAEESGPPPKGEPVDVPGSLGVTRTHYQSRGVVSLDVNSTALALGDQFSLTNDTTQATLIDHNDASLALSGDGGLNGGAWHLTDGYDVTLKLYLLDPTLANGFAQGENRLRLLVDDGGAGRTATTMMTLLDFTVFGPSTATFESGQQTVSGFQGGFEPLAKAVVTSGEKSILATGFLNITNQ